MTETPQPGWDALVGAMVQLRIQLSALDPELYDPLTLPKLAATEEQIGDAEARLGYALDPQHAQLLRTCNGWVDMYLDSNLLSTDQLGSGELWDLSMRNLSFVYDDPTYLRADDLPPRHGLLPLFASPYQLDVIAVSMNSPAPDGNHPVIWIANEIIGTYPDVRSWWIDMTELAERRVGLLLAGQ